MGFWGSLFGGSNPTLSSATKQFGQVAGQQLNQGQRYSTDAGTFWEDILSGNPAKQAQALSPEISGAKTRTEQDQKTRAMTGGRTGGTAAANAASTDKLHSDITNLIGSLTSSSANSLASLGTQMTSTGINSLNEQVNASELQMQNWKNSLFGTAITGAVNYGESFLPVPHGG